MADNRKKGFRWWLFNKIGPTEVQNLVNYIDEITEDGESDIVIYPLGDYPFQVRLSAGDQPPPFNFNTPQERQAFVNGLNFGVGIFGAKPQFLNEEDFQALDLMEEKSTHGSGGGRNN